ncbi:sugar phosphate isomerase/epimerase and 4-hydroxyphenylpyruvate domain-containing protein [Nocardioides sp. CFH 31398]|uniref:sugar phosphate isomerase/epimerase and 4-hydroxyphenylpyruvate domain-containing protein n=1 Tax=Nocardioides sp. CFH 31398 TaxID=2919579 RepID=UPI001F05063D|nr:sugar phosphate isomerase/epimerase and 4-hydroxyphenylpyruvate domain-containing protein [Nocardioides sp. CFH 31398]MCH1867898.1 TIM barrel protein [Nocardioides sp. CFH 31398]
MRTSIATVCLSGGLVEKLHACAEAGFDGVEVMDADLVAAYESPEEVRALADRLGLTLEMYQPFRDVEGVDEATFADTLRRAEATFALMQRLGTDLVLVCSNAGTATVDDDAVAADQLGRLADLAATYGVRVAYEALAWGRFVHDYRHAWRLVQAADRPNLGTCLDSFHILSRGHDPAAIRQIPAERIYFLQLADAPALQMDLLSWSRHHRLFPGEGSFDLVGFLGHVLAAGYDGPLSLEVFNDTFRQTDVVRTAAHARRSLAWLADRAGSDRLTAPPPPSAVDFVEVAGDDLTEVEDVLEALGFTFRGRHRSKRVRLWSAGDAHVVLDEQTRTPEPRLAGLGVRVADPAAAGARAAALGAPGLSRRTYAGEQPLHGVAAPDGTRVWFGAAHPTWPAEFEGGAEPGPDALAGVVDHVNLAQPWQDFDEAVLFYTSVLGLASGASTDVPGPAGLVRSQVMRTADGVLRIPLNMAPPTAPVPAQHVAVACDDVVGAARRARERGLRFLRVPANYYDHLAARFDLDAAFLDELRELDLLYDREVHPDGTTGEFLHFYTPTVGGVFLELVERRGGYDGYGAPNAAVRLAAQRAAG